MVEYWLPLLMIGLLFLAIFSGYPVALALGGLSTLFLLASDLPLNFFSLIVSRIYGSVLTNWLLLAIPMFILMGLILDRTGLAKKSFAVAERLVGRAPGGLGLAVIVIGSLLAASTGVVGASVVLLSLLALPKMVSAGYDKAFAAGLIGSTGTISILMPPSVMLIVLSGQMNVPVGSLFRAALAPSFMLLVAYALYVFIRAWLRPQDAPALKADSPELSGKIGFLEGLIALAPFVILIPLVLGSILLGYATPTEASGLGVMGALILALASRKIEFAAILSASRETASSASMIILLIIAATAFSAVFRGIGGEEMIVTFFDHLDFGAWGLLLFIVLIIFLLGFFLDWLEISLILLPVFAPIVMGLDFGNGLDTTSKMVWFAMIFAVCLQTSFLTPPFGISLIYLKGAVGDLVSTREAYWGVLPFIAIQIALMFLIMAVPSLLTF